MGIPAKLTHEEQALLNKFALLKKKKKVNANPKSIQSTSENGKLDLTVAKKDSSFEKRSPSKEPQIPPKDAKEKAKQLLASGQLKINKEAGTRSFKRARSSALEKKPREPSLTEAAFSNADQQQKIKAIRRDSYTKFVAGGDRTEQDQESDHKPNKPPLARQNCNLFVTGSGYGLTKNIMDTYFQQYGQVKNMYFDQDKRHGYVTYQRQEQAEKAIAELHGEMKDNVTLCVVYARKRPSDDNRFTHRPRVNKQDNGPPRQDLDKVPPGSTLPRLNSVSPTKKKEPKEKRSLVTYDDPDEFNF